MERSYEMSKIIMTIILCMESERERAKNINRFCIQRLGVKPTALITYADTFIVQIPADAARHEDFSENIRCGWDEVSSVHKRPLD